MRWRIFVDICLLCNAKSTLLLTPHSVLHSLLSDALLLFRLQRSILSEKQAPISLLIRLLSHWRFLLPKEFGSCNFLLILVSTWQAADCAILTLYLNLVAFSLTKPVATAKMRNHPYSLIVVSATLIASRFNLLLAKELAFSLSFNLELAHHSLLYLVVFLFHDLLPWAEHPWSWRVRSSRRLLKSHHLLLERTLLHSLSALLLPY